MMLILKNKIRMYMLLFKNYALIYLCLIACGAFFFNLIIGFIPMIHVYANYINVFISIVLVGLFLFKKYPILILNPANIHFLFGTKALSKLIGTKYLLNVFALSILSILITLCLFEKFSFGYYFHLLTTFSISTLILWKKYHKSLSIIKLSLICLVVNILFVFSFNIVGIIINLALIVFLALTKTNIKWDKYYADMKFAYKTQVVSVMKDWGAMMVITNDHIAKKKYLVTFSDKMLKYPLVAKNFMIDILRTSIQEWLLQCAFLVVALFLYVSPLMAKVYGIYIFALLISMVTSLTIRRNIIFVRNLKQKSKFGLFIPYSNKQIALSYLLSIVIQLILLFVILSIGTHITIINSIVTIAVVSLYAYMWIYFSLSFEKKSKLIDFIANGIISIIIIFSLV